MKTRRITGNGRQIRDGFTLIELLVVIGILVLLTSIVVVTIQSTRGSDRARSTARTAQSAFMGARDRAIHAKEARGIRMVRDSNSPNVITGFEYLRPLPRLTYGKQSGSNEIQLERQSGKKEVTRVFGFGSDQDKALSTSWIGLREAGLFGSTARIRIPASTGRWFPIQGVYDVSGNAKAAEIQIADFGESDPGYEAPSQVAVPMVSERASCEIELGNESLPFSQPITLASGIVIDLNWSEIAGLRRDQLVDPGRPLEFMFSPRGGMAGIVSALGVIHLLITDLQDAVSLDPNDSTLPLSPIHPKNRGEKLVMSVFPTTGNVQVHPIDPTDLVNNQTGAQGADGLADDLFSFARRGKAAN